MLEFLKAIAEKLGLDPATIEDEQTGQQAILAAIDLLVKGEEPEPETAPPADAPPATEASTGAPVKKETVTREFAASHSAKPSPMLVKTLAENRELKIGQLVRSGKLLPAAADVLRAQFIGKDNAVVALALSHGSDGNDFDGALRLIETNAPAREWGSKTGPQTTLTLSDPSKNKPVKSPLVEDMERRAKEAAERRQATAR